MTNLFIFIIRAYKEIKTFHQSREHFTDKEIPLLLIATRDNPLNPLSFVYIVLITTTQKLGNENNLSGKNIWV